MKVINALKIILVTINVSLIVHKANAQKTHEFSISVQGGVSWGTFIDDNPEKAYWQGLSTGKLSYGAGIGYSYNFKNGFAAGVFSDIAVQGDRSKLLPIDPMRGWFFERKFDLFQIVNRTGLKCSYNFDNGIYSGIGVSADFNIKGRYRLFGEADNSLIADNLELPNLKKMASSGFIELGYRIPINDSKLLSISLVEDLQLVSFDYSIDFSFVGATQVPDRRIARTAFKLGFIF